MRRILLLAGCLFASLVVISLIFLITQPVVAQGGQGEIILSQDDFNADPGHWKLRMTETTEAWLEDSAMHIRDFGGDSMAASVYFYEALSDFSVEMDTWLVEGAEGAWVSIYFRQADGDYYALIVHTNGWYKGREKINGENSNWLETTKSDAINTGPGAVNHLRIEAFGPQIRLYVNGVLLIDEYQPALTSGKVALAVNMVDGPDAVVAFDNVVVSVPGGPEQESGSGQRTLSYNFGMDDGSWWTGETDTGRVWIMNGALYVLNYTTAPYYTQTSTSDVFSNYTLDLESWLEEGTDDNFHFIVLHHNNADNYIRFGFSADGYVVAQGVVGGEEVDWLPATRHDAISVINRAHFDVNGPLLSFTLNDVLIAEVNEPRLTEGVIQLAAASFDGEYSTVAYDNVVIVDHAAPQPGRSSGKGSGSSEGSSESATIESDPAFEAKLADLTAPGEFTTPGADLNGYMYLTTEQLSPGVRMIQANVYYLSSGGGRVILMPESDQPTEISYTLDVPKSFAAHVDDLKFSQTPTQIIDPDPVVVFGITSDAEGSMITVDSGHVQADGQDAQSVLHVLQGFQYERTRRQCAEATTFFNMARCYLQIATSFPDHVTEEDCDQVFEAGNLTAADTSDEWYLTHRDEVYLTCRAILTRDPWECSRIEQAELRPACINDLEEAMQSRCALLTGAAESACLAEGGIKRDVAASTSDSGSSSGQAAQDPSVPRAGTWQYTAADGTGYVYNYPVSVTVRDNGAVVVINHQGVFADEFHRVSPGVYRYETAPSGDEIYGTTVTLTVESPTSMKSHEVIGPSVIDATFVFSE